MNNNAIRTTPDDSQSPQASASTNSATRACDVTVVADGVSQEIGYASSANDNEEKFPAREISTQPRNDNAGKQSPIAYERFQRCPCGKRHRDMPEYSSWRHAVHRATNPSYDGYKNYGARGIGICARWLGSFHAFLDDMGTRPPGTSLERTNNELGYHPGNCVWATQTVQARNTRMTKLNESAAAEIRRMRVAGIPQRTIAKQFGVARNLVRKIEAGKAWR